MYVFPYGFTHRVGDGTLERVLPCGFKDSNGFSLVSARAGVDRWCLSEQVHMYLYLGIELVW